LVIILLQRKIKEEESTRLANKRRGGCRWREREREREREDPGRCQSLVLGKEGVNHLFLFAKFCMVELQVRSLRGCCVWLVINNI
jgi:hypothetical protein